MVESEYLQINLTFQLINRLIILIFSHYFYEFSHSVQSFTLLLAAFAEIQADSLIIYDHVHRFLVWFFIMVS